MLARIPSGRFVTPEEVAAAVIYLASPQAASVTARSSPSTAASLRSEKPSGRIKHLGPLLS